MQNLIDLLKSGENQLMRRILAYARRFDYAKYTSTLEEAWRMSIAGLTDSIEKSWNFYGRVPEFGPDDDFRSDPAAYFGILEAQRHRERGVSLCMFLSFFKYYRQTYMDHVREAGFEQEYMEEALRFLMCVFDRMEIAYCDEWSGKSCNEMLLELQAANRYMTNEKNAYLTVFESVSSPIILLDAEGGIVNLNYQAAVLVDSAIKPGQNYYSTNGMRQFAAMHSDASGDDAMAQINRFTGSRLNEHFGWLSNSLEFSGVNGDNSLIYEAEYPAPNGEKRCFEVQISRMLDVSEKFAGTLIILNDITERRNMLEDLKFLATVDPLTGAYNRRHFFDLARRELLRAQRYGRRLSLIEADLDHFKEINDTYGHHVGDEVLKLFVKTVADMLRTSDTLGRLGGEEFAVILPETPQEAAFETAERIRRRVAELSYTSEKGEVRFSVSISVAGIEACEGCVEDSVEELLKRADFALYDAKKSGRNSVKVFS